MYYDLKQELERTGLTLRVLAQKIIEHDRSMLPPDVLKSMMAECELRVLQPHFPIILEAIGKLENSPEYQGDDPKRFRSRRKIAVTKDMRRFVQVQIKEPKLSITLIQRTQFADMPSLQLNTVINRMLSGDLKNIDQEIWEGLTCYAESIDPVTLPEVAPSAPKDTPRKAIYAPDLPDAEKTAGTLADTYHRELTSDLTEKTMTTQNPRPQLAYHRVSKRLTNMGYVVIDDEIYQQLHDERRRTQVSVRRLLKGSPTSPASLRVHTAEQWFNGSVLSAEKTLLEWVLNAYAALPDAPSPEE